jgi:hypothetical protein
LDSDQTVAAIIATQKNAECDPDPTLSEEQVNLPKLDHKAKNYSQTNHNEPLKNQSKPVETEMKQNMSLICKDYQLRAAE